MTTGHINPGYYFPVSNLERINKLPSTNENKILNGLTPEITNKRWLLTQPNLSNDILENIRRKARESWRTVDFRDNNSLTTYSGNFHLKNLDEPAKIRPTSPTRMNNPHPSAIFLTCRLHNMPGFHKVDSFQSINNRTLLSSKTNKVEGEYESLEKEESNRSQSVKTELSKHSMSENDKVSVSEKETVDSTHCRNQSQAQTIELARPKSTISLHSNHSSGHVSSIRSAKSQRPSTCFPRHQVKGWSNPSVRCKSMIYQKTEYPRGDYLIHYQWPVTIPHHKLF